MERLPKFQARRLALLCWILVAVFYFYVASDYIRVSMNDNALGEYVRHVVQLAGAESSGARDVQTLILLKADELGLPLHGGQITIQGQGQALRVSVEYTVDIQVPIFEWGTYSKRFRHTASYLTPL